MKRTPLKRRTPLRAVSRKRAKQLPKRAAFVRDFLRERPACERCRHRATDVHERLQRSLGGDILNADNCVSLCRPCHSWVHDNVGQAHEEGWLIRSTDPRAARLRG